MATIGSLVVDLKAETAAFRRDLGRARRDVKTFSDRTNRSLTTVTRGFSVMAARAKTFIGVFAATAGVRGIDQVLQSVTNLADTADKLGLTTDRLQELRFAAEQTGVASNTLDMAMQRFTRRLGEAAQGGGELKGVLDQYGISVTDSAGRTRDQAAVLGELAEVIRKADSDAERLRIAFKAFDSEGAALVNVLRDGRAGLERWSQAARDAGVVMDADLIQKAREINAEWETLIETIGVKAKGAIISFIAAVREGFSEQTQASGLGALRTQLEEAAGGVTTLQQAIDNLARTATQITPGGTAVAGLADDMAVARIQAQALQNAISSLGGAFGKLPEAVEIESVGFSQQVQDTIEALRFQAEQLSRTAEVQRVYTEARRAGVEVDSAAGMEIRNLVERLQEAERAQTTGAAAAQASADEWREFQDAVRRAADATDDGMRTIQSSSERSLGAMGRDLLAGENAMDSLANAARQTVNAIISEFLRLAVIRPIIGSIFGAIGGGVTGIGATSATQATAAGGTGLLFQHGGSFIADGPGGTDAIAARINVSKGEEVTVKTAAQQRQGGGGGLTINQTFNIEGNDAGNFAIVQRLMREMEQRTVAAIQQLMNDGGPLAIAAGRRR